ncbi:hypothetical protein [Bradyrhizobium sp. HKCCYLR20261]|uniref:hypothetical protein n=1 Tax=Bradyrhizobium sp. HKCCYLR20261 TaxID=3420760 RepID=UPI003EBA542E
MDIEIHRQRDLILAGIGDFTAKPSSLRAALEECLFLSRIHREIHVPRVFAADRDRMLNWVANPEAQNASRGEDVTLMGQCRSEGRIFQPRPAHRLSIAIEYQVEPSWTDVQHEFDLSIVRGNDLSRVSIDAEVGLDICRRRFKDDGFGVDVERRKVWAHGNATLTPY